MVRRLNEMIAETGSRPCQFLQRTLAAKQRFSVLAGGHIRAGLRREDEERDEEPGEDEDQSV